MPVNRNALIRYKTIDTCLRNRYRQWTLEDHVTSARQKTVPVIDFEKNENLKGLEYLDGIYHAIVSKQTLLLKYRSFKARSASEIVFYPYLLKEYRNRWFVFGVMKKDKSLRNLALDRIHSLEPAINERFLENTFFNPATFFDDLVGVTKGLNSQTEKVRFWASRGEAPYIQTKPVQKTQHLVEFMKQKLEKAATAYNIAIRVDEGKS